MTGERKRPYVIVRWEDSPSGGVPQQGVDYETDMAQSRFVDLGDGQRGIQTREFDLHRMISYSQDPDFNGSGRPDEVYFRTRSGNIYFIDKYGRLVNRDLSLRSNEPHIERLDSERFGGDIDPTIRLNSIFLYGERRWTTTVREIVATSEAMKIDPTDTHIRASSIVADFYKDLPVIPPFIPAV